MRDQDQRVVNFMSPVVMDFVEHYFQPNSSTVDSIRQLNIAIDTVMNTDDHSRQSLPLLIDLLNALHEVEKAGMIPMNPDQEN